MIIFILRRLVLLGITLFLLSLVAFSLSYFTPHAPWKALRWAMPGGSGSKVCCNWISACPVLTASQSQTS